MHIHLCSAFTTPPTADIVSPGLVEDGVKCGSEMMCFEQRCMSVSEYRTGFGVTPCPIGSNGKTCSGNGVRSYRLATLKSAH